MGWCDGATLAESVWLLIRDYIPEGKRQQIALKMIDSFENEDADTMGEAHQLMKDAGRTEEEEPIEDEFFDRY
jgi:hypothetical protein